MAMSNYTDLKASLVDWLNRDGFSSLTDRADDFMDMAQRRIFRDCDLTAMEVELNTTTATPTAPSDFLRTKTMTIIQGSNNFEVNGSTHKKVMQAGTNGRPLYYSLIGDQFKFGPTADQEYGLNIVYFAPLTLLSDSNATNWLSINIPEIILFGALLEASLFLKDDQRAQVWVGRYEEVKKSLMDSEERDSKEGGSLQVREQISRYQGSTKLY